MRSWQMYSFYFLFLKYDTPGDSLMNKRKLVAILYS
jgi:hypothetical protein